MNHRSLVKCLKICISADDLLPLAIELVEHLDRISFDLQSFSVTFGLSFLGTYISDNVPLEEFKRLYQFVKHFHGRLIDINVVLKSYLQAIAIALRIKIKFTNVQQILKILLPFCTTIFSNQTPWVEEIPLFYQLHDVIHEVVESMLNCYGNQENYTHFPNCQFKIYSLRHLSRNKVRDLILQNSESQEFVHNVMSLEIPLVLRQYLRFQDNAAPILY